jgi:hypothetical protein
LRTVRKNDDPTKKHLGEIDMKSQSRALLIGSMTALASVLSPATASATGSCYAFTDFDNVTNSTIDGGPPIALRYIAKSAGLLNSVAEAKKFAHLKQTLYNMNGKATVLFDVSCDAPTLESSCPVSGNGPYQVRLMTTIDGTIVTGQAVTPYTADEPGAHMGVNVQFLRRIPGISGFAVGPFTLECSSPQVSANPAYWFCNVRAEIDGPVNGFFLQLAAREEVVLQKVSPNDTPACSVFEDGALRVVE